MARDEWEEYRETLDHSDPGTVGESLGARRRENAPMNGWRKKTLRVSLAV